MTGLPLLYHYHYHYHYITSRKSQFFNIENSFLVQFLLGFNNSYYYRKSENMKQVQDKRKESIFLLAELQLDPGHSVDGG